MGRVQSLKVGSGVLDPVEAKVWSLGRKTVRPSLFLCNGVIYLLHHLVDRVRWFRARADMERWQEEVIILREEFKCTYRSFMFFSNAWRKAGLQFAESKVGYHAYALGRASIYLTLAVQCKEHFESIEKEVLDSPYDSVL